MKRTRKNRKRGYIRTKNRIVQAYRSHNRLFYTRDIMVGENVWLDISFLSVKKRDFYNCIIVTTLDEIVNKASELAIEKAYNIVPHNEDDELKFKPTDDGHYELITSKKTYSEFGNRTRHEFIVEEEKKLLNSGDLFSKPTVEIYDHYKHGIGLKACLIGEKLDVDMINNFIIDFINNGEKPFIKDEKTYHKIDDLSQFCPSNGLNIERSTPYPEEIKGQAVDPQWLKKYRILKD